MKTKIYIVRTKNFDGEFVTCGMFPTMKQAKAYAEKIRRGGGYCWIWCDCQDIQPGK
jgi:hypothetical protein